MLTCLLSRLFLEKRKHALLRNHWVLTAMLLSNHETFSPLGSLGDQVENEVTEGCGHQ